MFKEVHVEDIESRAGAQQIAELLAHYRSLSSDGELPSYADFNPERLAEHASNLAVVEPIDCRDYLYIYYGRTIFETSGVEMLGSKVSQWKSEVGAFFCQAYDRAVSELRPIYTVHRAHHAIRVHLWERLVMPARAEDGSLRLVVFNKPREYLDDLLQAVLNASPDGVLGLRCVRSADSRIEDAMVVTANQRGADIIGCAVENLLDHPILDVIPKLRGTKTWARCLEVVETRQPQHFELSLCHSDQAKWFDVNAVPLGDKFMLSITDITSLKSAYHELEAKIRELAKADATLGEEVNRREALEGELGAQQQLDLALNNMIQGLVLLDPSGRVVVVNQRYIDMYRLSPDLAKPGCVFRDLLAHRKETGTFAGDIDDYCSSILQNVAQRATTQATIHTPDGRTIHVVNRPLTNGGWVSTHEDITEQRRAEAEREKLTATLDQQNMRFKAALDNMGEGLCMFDAEKRLVVCNDRYAKMYQLPADLLEVGTPHSAIIAHRVSHGILKGDTNAGAVDKKISALGQLPADTTSSRIDELADGRLIRVTRMPMTGGGWVATHADVTAQCQSEAKIVHMAHHDALTGLANRVLLNERLEDALTRTKRGDIVAAHILDLDHFKHVNDTLGHPVGDKLLQMVGARLQALVRDTDTIARMGGDEFAIVQVALSQVADATHWLNVSLQRFASLTISTATVATGTSVGIAVAPTDGLAPIS